MGHYRLNMRGQRQVHAVLLHIAARVQISTPNATAPGRVYVHRDEDEGPAEALRSLKRLLSNAAHRALQSDLAAREVSGEDNQAA